MLKLLPISKCLSKQSALNYSSFIICWTCVSRMNKDDIKLWIACLNVLDWIYKICVCDFMHVQLKKKT